jgi:hypothetical protein
MALLLTFARWLGLRGAVALLALSCAGVLYFSARHLQTRLSLSEARVSVLEAQRDAANALAADYQARAERAVQAQREADKARRLADAVRARKWKDVRAQERAWAEVAVPESVVEALR